ncbi:MAG: SnoaL-like domain [Solirubrobacterales bacterium]|nr:SnoaL-like domain [Solirubrobacterales bacterium]
MAEHNVELVKSVYRAVNDDDLPAFLALMHPDVELTTSGAYPDFHNSYRGHTGAVDYWKAVRDVWDAFSIEIGRCEPVGDQVVVLVRQEVEGRDGIVVEHDWGHLFSFADGRIRRVRAYVSWQAAMETASLASGAGRG